MLTRLALGGAVVVSAALSFGAPGEEWREDASGKEPTTVLRKLRLVVVEGPTEAGEQKAPPDEKKLAELAESLAKRAHCSAEAAEIRGGERHEEGEAQPPENLTPEPTREVCTLKRGGKAAAADMVHALCRAIERGSEFLLRVEVGERGELEKETVQAVGEYGEWLEVNQEAVENARAVSGMTLPDGWSATIDGEDTYLIAPERKDVKKGTILKIPAHEIDTVKPVVLGQEETRVRVRRVEESGKDEPRAYMQFKIPAEAWKNAKLNIPVIKLINAQ